MRGIYRINCLFHNDDSKLQPIKLTQVKHEEDGDYYLEINTLSKQFKETSKNRKFKERFEEKKSCRRQRIP